VYAYVSNKNVRKKVIFFIINELMIGCKITKHLLIV
jgi:hypothetical protein